MTKSMTGYGRSQFKTPFGSVRIEIKTTNHRFLEFSSRLPHSLQSYEDQVRKMIKGKIARGKVHLWINVPEALLQSGKLIVNEKFAKEYYKALQKLNRVLGLKEKISINQVMRMPEVISRSSSSDEMGVIWKRIRSGLNKSLMMLDASRKNEGKALQKDILSRCTKISQWVNQMQKQTPKLLAAFKKKVTERLGKDIKTPQGKEKFHQEILSYSKSTDITEEVVRMKSHLKSMSHLFRENGEKGRRIDFILQEMMREINTTGAKCNDSFISARVVDSKTELEKIREQAQNLE